MGAQGYRVATEDLQKIATDLKDMSSDLSAMRSSISDQLPGDHDLGVPELLPVFNTLTTWVESHLDDLGKGLQQTSDDVRTSAESYFSIDNEIAQRLTSLLGGLSVPADISTPAGQHDGDITSRLLPTSSGHKDDPAK